MNIEQLRKINEFNALLQAMRNTVVFGTKPNMDASKSALTNMESWLTENSDFNDSYVQILGKAAPLLPELVEITDAYIAKVYEIVAAEPELLGIELPAEEQPE